MKRIIILMILFYLISVTFWVDNEERPQEVDLDISNNSSLSQSTRSAESWYMYGYDLQHTGNTTSGAPMTNKVLWSNRTGDITGSEAELYSSPVISNGKVYIGTRSSYIYCFDEYTGETLWYKKFDKITWGICSTPTLINGKMYIGTEDHNVNCLDPDNGDLIWNYTTDGQVWSSPAVFGNRVYIGSLDYYLYCLDEITGDLIWKFKSAPTTYGYQDYGISSTPAISNGKLFVGACDGKCYALPLDDPNGDGVINATEKLWEFDTGSYVYGSPTVFNGKVYIGTGTYKRDVGPAIHKIYCLDENTGTKLWEFEAGNHFMSTPAIAYGKLYIGSLDGYFYCLPLEDPNSNGVIAASEVVWKFKASNVIWSSPAVAGQKVYFGSGVPNWEEGDGNYSVFCLPINDPNNDAVISNSEMIWNYKIDAGVLTSPTVANDKLFVSTYDGKLICFADGATLPKVQSTTPPKDEQEVTLEINISVEFTKAINTNTLTATNFVLENEDSVKVPGEIIYNDINNTAIFNPNMILDENELYTVTLTSDIKDTDGNGLDCDGDGVFEPEDVYYWSFTTKLCPPAITTIPVQRPIESEDWYLDMSLYVTDPNTPFEDLTITENSSYAEVINGVIIFNYPDGITREDVNISVSDEFSTVWQLVRVEVKIANDPPMVSALPDIHALEDEAKIVEVSKYISDIDNELWELTVTTNSSYAIVKGMNITFNYPNGIIAEIVNLTVTDGNKIGWQHVRVIITPVNDPPSFTDIPDLHVVEDIEFVFNITEYIYDIDNSIDELELSTDSSFTTTEKTGDIGMTEFRVIFKYPNGVLFETLKLTINDGALSTSRELNVTVEPVNDPPTVSDIPNQSALEDMDLVLELSKYIDDIDTSPEDFRIFSNSKYLIKREGLELTFNYPDGITEEVVNVSIKDGIYTYFSDFIINITPVNDPPKLFNDAVVPITGDTDTEFRFTVIFWDVDCYDNPRVELVIDEFAYEMVAVNHTDILGTCIQYTYTLQLAKGTHGYYFRCDDNSGQPNSTYETTRAYVPVTATAELAPNIAVIAAIVSSIIILVILIFIVIKKRRDGKKVSSVRKKKKVLK